jgi:TonB family protein
MDTTEVGASSRRRLWKGIACLGVSVAAVALLGAGDRDARSPAPPAEGPPYRVGGEISPPLRLSGAAPAYTQAARRARIEGVAIVEAVIDERGEVTSTRILKGLPMGLDGAAMDAVKTWKFQPAKRLGEAVPVYFVITVNFRIESDFAPVFAAFLRDHDDVRALVEQHHYAEAGELIDRFLVELPGESSLLFGRAYMHLAESQFADAWRLAQSVSGPEQAEIAQAIAVKAAQRLRGNPTAPDSERTEIAELGNAASALAVELTAGDATERAASALRTRSELLRLQAALESDAAAREELLDEARALAARADEIHPPGAIPDR